MRGVLLLPFFESVVMYSKRTTMLENKIPKNLVVTGYSGGGGKTHLLKKCLDPIYLGATHLFSVSHTSRAPRGKEEEGKDYFFREEAEFLQMLKEGKFLEWSNPRPGVWYGTSVAEYNRIIALGKAVAFDIDRRGVEQLSFHGVTRGTLCVIAPLPNVDTRRRWMEQRGDMSQEKISERLVYSEKHERPFFDNPEVNNFVHWKIFPYNETLPASDDIVANIIANHIYHGTPLEMPKSPTEK